MRYCSDSLAVAMRLHYKSAFGGEGGCWARLVPEVAIDGVSPIYRL
jgi:hypothetical protein